MLAKTNEETGKTTVPSEKQKCIDLEYLTKRTKANPVLMMEMIAAYLEQTPPLINTMKQSLINKDWILLNATVHKIIPSFSIMGISNDFVTIAKKVQHYANTQQESAGIPGLILALQQVCEQACIELAEEFNTIKQNNL